MLFRSVKSNEYWMAQGFGPGVNNGFNRVFATKEDAMREADSMLYFNATSARVVRVEVVCETEAWSTSEERAPA